MNMRQFAVVILCMFLNMLDGFDLFIVGFALPHIPSGFATSGQKGLVISLALIGMGVGAVALARLADRFGRRSTVLAGIVLNIIGLVASALAINYQMLMAGRFVTGLGVGTISVVIVVIAQESSLPRYRNLSTGIVMLGFPLGSTVAGLGGAWVLSLTGHAWQSLFWFGAVLGVIGFVIGWLAVPESAAFLAKRAGNPGDLTIGATVTAADDRIRGADALDDNDTRLLGRGLRRKTLLLTTGYGMVSAAYYFVGTWTPQLITDATDDAGAGSVAGIVVSVGTLVGAVTFALLGLHFAAVRMVWIFLVTAMVSLAAFALLVPHLLAYAFAGMLGMTVFAAMSGYTAMIPAGYPVLARAKGYGAMLGVGRVGAMLAPIIAGYALAAVTPKTLYLLALVPLGITVATALALLGKTSAPEPGSDSSAGELGREPGAVQRG